MNKLLKCTLITILMFTIIATLLTNVKATETPKPSSEQTQTYADDDGVAKDGDTEVTWVDFSKAKFELKKNGQSDAIIEISGVTPIEDNSHKLIITNSPTPIEATEENFKNAISLEYNNSDKVFKTLDVNDKVANSVESNQEIYVNVIERATNEKYELVYNTQKSNVKLERYAEPKYSDSFFATYMTNDSTQIVMNFTHSKSNIRKMQIKVGKVTDTEILKKIKNQNSTGFADLLKFAKANSGIYNNSVNSNDSFSIEYNTNESNGAPIKLDGLEDNAYYFLYVKTDDENGKYISNEAITLAEAKVHENGWGMFFYGSSDFKWVDFNETNGDAEQPEATTPETTYPEGKLPQTGMTLTVVFATLGITVVAVVCAKKVKKYTI